MMSMMYKIIQCQLGYNSKVTYGLLKHRKITMMYTIVQFTGNFSNKRVLEETKKNIQLDGLIHKLNLDYLNTRDSQRCTIIVQHSTVWIIQTQENHNDVQEYSIYWVTTQK